MTQHYRLPGRDRATEISKYYGSVSRVQYHSGKLPAVVNRMGIVPSAYVNDPELKNGLELVMNVVDLYLGWVEGAPVFDLDEALLDDIFARHLNGGQTQKAKQDWKAEG